MTGKHSRYDRRGTSMIEVIISTLLIGLVMIGALNSVGAAIRTSRIGAEQIDGRTLAASLMAEVIAMPYEDMDDAVAVDFGIESDEPASPANRAAFDDLDDYRNWTETPPTKKDGTAVANAASWSRTVTIKKLSATVLTALLADTAVDNGVRRVTVVVTDPDGGTTTLQAIRSKQGAVEQLPGVDTTFVTGVTIELDAGGTQAITSGTNFINHATGP